MYLKVNVLWCQLLPGSTIVGVFFCGLGWVGLNLGLLVCCFAVLQCRAAFNGRGFTLIWLDKISLYFLALWLIASDEV